MERLSNTSLLRSRLTHALLFIFVFVSVINASLQSNEDVPPFMRAKFSEALQKQPLMASSQSGFPSVKHYIHATLYSRNDRHHKRHEEAYDAHALISEDSITATMRNQKHNHEYIYENGRLLRDEMCVEDSIAPMVHFSDLATKLTDLRKNLLIDHTAEQVNTFDADLNQECANLKMYGIVYAGQHFVLCANEHELRHVVGASVWIEINEWSVDPHVIQERRHSHQLDTKPHLLKTCPFPMTMYSPQTVQPFTALKTEEPWFQKGSYVCQLPFLRDSRICQQNNHQPIEEDEKKDCVFLHGVGEWITGNLTDTFEDYWGHVEDYTPQCKTRTFVHQETKMRGWDNADLQEAYCEAALVGNKAGDRTIRDKILFVHSMGNLILSGAIKSGKCSIEKKSTSWFNIMGPLYGSKAAIMLQRICSDVNSGIANKIYRFIALQGGYCMPNSNSSYPAYATLSPLYEGVKDLMLVAQKYVTGSMCGDSPTGILTRYSVLKALAFVVGYEDPNDGMVPIPSCSIPSVKYENEFGGAWYRVDGNHADGTCRNNDSWLFSAKPCSFYTGKR